MFKIILGALIVLASIWGGGFFLAEVIPAGHWTTFPTGVTSIFLAGVGMVVAVDGSLQPPKREW